MYCTANKLHHEIKQLSGLLLTPMPLLNGKVFITDKALSPELKPEQEVWRVRATGEICLQYSELLDRQALYRSRVFCCGFTGKNGLNFEEAQREDDKAREALVKVAMCCWLVLLWHAQTTTGTAVLWSRQFVQFLDQSTNPFAGTEDCRCVPAVSLGTKATY